MINTFLLSGFYILSMLACIGVFSRLRVEEPIGASSSPSTLSKGQLSLFIVAAIIFFAAVTAWLFRTGTVDMIQYVLLGAFTVAWVINAFYLLTVFRTWLRLGIAAIVSFSILTLVIISNSQLAENIFIAGSMLWVGPVLIKRYNVSFRILNILFAVLVLFDLWYVFLAEGPGEILNQPLFFNGLVSFGTQGLGAGDILISYLLINAAHQWRGRKAASVLAVLFAIIPVLIYFFAVSAEIVLPFTMFIIPVAWVVYIATRRPNARRSV